MDACWEEWCDLVGRFLAKISRELRPELLVVMPTGEAALYPGELILSRLLQRLQMPEMEVVVGEKPVGALVRGAALGAQIELHSMKKTEQVRDILFREHGGPSPELDPSSEESLQAFRALDASGSGAIEAEAVLQWAAGKDLSLTDAEAEGVIRNMSPNGASRVTPDLFRQWWGAAARSAQVLTVMSEAQLHAVLNRRAASEAAVLQVSSARCRACRKFENAYFRFSREFKHVRFLQVNGDHSQASGQLCAKLGVEVTPTFVFFRGQQRVGQYAGSSKEAFADHLQRAAAAAPAADRAADRAADALDVPAAPARP